MYKSEINEIKSAKREAFMIIMNDYLKLYFRLKIGYPNLLEERYILKCLIKQYIKYDNNELEVLNLINKKYKYANNDIIYDLLDEFDSIYEEYYNYIDKCISSYEEVIESNIIKLIINRLNGNYLESNNIKYRMKLPKIGKSFNNKYKYEVLNKLRSM